MLLFLTLLIFFIFWLSLMRPNYKNKIFYIGLLSLLAVSVFSFCMLEKRFRARKREKKEVEKTPNNISYYYEFLKQHSKKDDFSKNMGNMGIFVINLSRARARRIYIQKQIERYGIDNIKFIDGIDGKKLPNLQSYFFEDVSGNKIKFLNNDAKLNSGEVGCLLSHFKAIKECYDKNLDYVLICEDDISFSLAPFWDSKLEEILENAPRDWELISLVYKPGTGRPPGTNNPGKKDYVSYVEEDCWGFQAYVINREGAKKVIDTLKVGPDLFFFDIEKGSRNYNAADVLITDITNSYSYTKTLFFSYNDGGEMDSLIHSDHTSFHNKYSLETIKDYYNKILAESTNIPKKLHLIWIGPKKAPSTISTWTEDFAKAYPDWEIKVWGEKDIESLNLVNRKEYGAVKEYAAKADIARYEILYRFGGMYVDADAIWLKRPLNPVLFKGRFNVFREKEDCIANGWINTIPKHPFLKEVIKRIPERVKKFPIDEAPYIQTGPRLFQEVYEELENILDSRDFNLVDWDLVLCPSKKDGGWHNIKDEDDFWQRWDKCQRSGALFFHWGITTNGFNIDPDQFKNKISTRREP